MKKTPAYRAALCGVLGALAVVLMLLGGIVPVAIYCCPMLACLLLVPLLEVCTRRLCLCWYAAVALLSLLLVPDKEPAIVFAFLGWYPIAREPLGSLPRVLRVMVKLLIFNAALVGMYALTVFVLGIEAAAAEFQTMQPVFLGLLWLLSNVVFLVLDLLLKRMTVYFRLRMGRR